MENRILDRYAYKLNDWVSKNTRLTMLKIAEAGFLFVFKSGESKIPVALFKVEKTFRNTSNFAKSCPNPGPFIKLLHGKFIIALIQGFLLPKQLCIIRKFPKSLNSGTVSIYRKYSPA